MTKAKSKHQTRHKKCFFFQIIAAEKSHPIWFAPWKSSNSKWTVIKPFWHFTILVGQWGFVFHGLWNDPHETRKHFIPYFGVWPLLKSKTLAPANVFLLVESAQPLDGRMSFQTDSTKKGTEITLNFVFIYIHMCIYIYIYMSIYSTYTCNVHSMYISFFLCILKHISTRICEKLPPISKSGRQFPSNRNWEPRAGGAKDAAAPGGEIK